MAQAVGARCPPPTPLHRPPPSTRPPLTARTSPLLARDPSPRHGPPPRAPPGPAHGADAPPGPEAEPPPAPRSAGRLKRPLRPRRRRFASRLPHFRPPAMACRLQKLFGADGDLADEHSGKLLDEILVSAPQTPAHGALAKPRAEVLPSSSPPTEDFGKGPWLAMKAELKLDERDPSCFLRTYSVVMVLRKAALKQLPKNKVPSMAVMIKTLTRTNVDAGAVFRDPTGEMQGTVHRLLLEERQGELRPGSVLLLRQVGVFSPSHRNHYLNVTPNNLLKIYPPEPEGSFLQQEVHAQAGLLPDHPTQPPQGVPAAGDWGQMRAGACGTEQASGGLSLHSQSPRPGQEELVRADGCDMDDLDGLLGELPEDFFSAPAQADCC
ncbi:homologous recombination OB-fold protein [Pogoniulus pusillus]|uniref:homologous recombination OB-fold protein n=1 Tax=Pogoniulus pusillus TaxID=488313 RepID=UPI0030B9987F